VNVDASIDDVSLEKLLNLSGSRQRSTNSNVGRNPDALHRKNLRREINNKVQENTTRRNYTAGYYRNEAQASKMVRVAWESGDTNRSDILTKLVHGPRLRDLSGMIMY
jgi:hypothetical protein